MTKPMDPNALDAFREAQSRYGLTPTRSEPAPTIAAADWAVVCHLLRDGLSPAEIAERTGVSLAEVEQINGSLRDTRELARQFLHGEAIAIAQRVVKDADVDQGLELLDRLGVAERRDAGNRAGGNVVNIVVGMPGQPAGPDPFLAIDAAALKPHS